MSIAVVLLGMMPCASCFANVDKMSNPVVIDHLEAATGRYIGSPSVAILDDGTYIASHDEFGPKSAKNLTSVFASSDHGATWTKRVDVVGQFWSSLFTLHGSLFLLGTDKEFGSIIIRKSIDGGRTWSNPTTAKSGLLVTGSYHCAPTPIVHHGGKLWRAVEDIGGPGDWPTHFRCLMLSAPDDADLLKAESWTRSNVIGRNADWLNGLFHGWLEGNAVVDHEGSVIDLLRVDAKPLGDVAAIVRINPIGTVATFDPKQDFISMPGGSVKFTVRTDPVSGQYWALTNAIPDGVITVNPGIERNTLALINSPNLRDWQLRAVIWHKDDASRYGCQYADWSFDGDDLIAVARVANDDKSGGPHDFHDANFLMFYRISNFRGRQLGENNLGLSFERKSTLPR